MGHRIGGTVTLSRQDVNSVASADVVFDLTKDTSRVWL